MVINYILGTKSEENKDAQPLIELMNKSKTLRSTKDPKVAVPLISELKSTIEQVEPGLRKSAEVIMTVL